MANGRKAVRTAGAVVSVLLAGCGGSGHLSEIIPAGLYRPMSEVYRQYPDLNSVPQQPRRVPQYESTANQANSGAQQRAERLQRRQPPPKLEIDEPDWPIDE